MSVFKDKVLLITGGTGSFGNAVLRRFLTSDIKEIRIFSRDEKKQDEMRHRLQAQHPKEASKVHFIIGNVRDLDAIDAAMHGVDYVFSAAALKQVGADAKNTSFGSCLFANKPGDGSAREQAASCQKVLGGDANICYEYATKRYRSNCINWGIMPFTIAPETKFDYEVGDFVFVPGIRQAVLDGKEEIDAKVITKNGVKDIHLFFQNLTKDERTILTEGCLMNYYASQK